MSGAQTICSAAASLRVAGIRLQLLRPLRPAGLDVLLFACRFGWFVFFFLDVLLCSEEGAICAAPEQDPDPAQTAAPSLSWVRARLDREPTVLTFLAGFDIVARFPAGMCATKSARPRGKEVRCGPPCWEHFRTAAPHAGPWISQAVIKSRLTQFTIQEGPRHSLE